MSGETANFDDGIGDRRGRMGRAAGADPLRAVDFAVVVVAGGVLQDVAGAFVEVVQRQRMLVRLQTVLRRVVLRIAGDAGDATFVDAASEQVLGFFRRTTDEAARFIAWCKVRSKVVADPGNSIDVEFHCSSVENSSDGPPTGCISRVS